MRLQTNLVRRGSRFYYRGRVPEDLKQHYGRAEILISLQTADRRKADHALAQIKAKPTDSTISAPSIPPPTAAWPPSPPTR